MGVAEVNHFDWRFAAGRRMNCCWLWGWEGQVEWTDIGEVAETDQGRAERLGCVGAHFHVLKGVVEGWNLASDDTSADIPIFCLHDGQ